MRQSGKTLALLREAAAAQQAGGAVVVIHRRDFERYCRDLAAAKGIDLTGVRFMTHDQVMRQEWRGRPARYFLDYGPWPPLGFYEEWGKLRNWLLGRVPAPNQPATIAPMPRKPKKPHWDAQRLDDMLSGKTHEVPEHLRNLGKQALVGHSTTAALPMRQGVPTISRPGQPGIAKYTVKVDSSQPELTTTEEQEPAAPASKRTHEGDGK